jgi:hypothetical protein
MKSSSDSFILEIRYTGRLRVCSITLIEHDTDDSDLKFGAARDTCSGDVGVERLRLSSISHAVL